MKKLIQQDFYLLKKIFNIDKGGAKDFDKQIRLIV